MRIDFVIGMVGLVGLTGCAAAPLGSPAVATPGMPNIQAALNRAIDRTDAAVDQLNGVPITRLASARLPAVVPAELQQPIAWLYRGHLVHAVRALANIVGYQTVVERAHPHHPIPVTISAQHEPVMTVIRELGIQAGSRADVAVDPRTHTISVIETGAAPPSPPPGAVLPGAIRPGSPMIQAQPLATPADAVSVPITPPSARPQSLNLN